MSELLKPPAVPLALLHFFATQPDFFAVLGDMTEEFHRRSQVSRKKAVRWFWCEVIRNSCTLTIRELVRSPLRTGMIAIGCLAGMNLVMLSYILIRMYPAQWQSYFEFLSRQPGEQYVFLRLQFLGALSMGILGAKFLRGREWALTLTFTVITIVPAVIGAWYLYGILKWQWPPAPYFSLSLAIAGTVLRLAGISIGSLLIRRLRIGHLIRTTSFHNLHSGDR